VSDPAVAARRELYQELRLALVFNGGVSLAVWMGGAAKEIDRFRRAFSGPPADQATLAPYRELLDVLRTVVVTDVIAGASAGGINGALLAYVIANGKSLECAGPNGIRETWQEVGSMSNLLPTRGVPRSVLKTDEVLFAGCANAFSKLRTAAPDLSDDVPRWVRLAVAATDAHGYQVTAPATAAADAEVAAVDHRLLFRFRRIVPPAAGEVLLGEELLEAIDGVVANGSPKPAGERAWPFPRAASARDLDGDGAAALLTRAARTTSSFPIAFHPSELPLNYTAAAPVDGLPGAALTETPAMGDVVVAPAAEEIRLLPADAPELPQLARFAIDGGVWDNSPFAAVMAAVEKTPSSRDVRRVLAYLVGTNEPPAEALGPQDPPPLLQSLTKAVALPADLAFANDLARIRADCERQHAHRDNVLRLLTSEQTDLHETARQLFPVYKAKLEASQNGGPALAAPVLSLDRLPGPDDDLAAWLATPAGWGWGVEPVRATVQRARRLLRALLRAADAADLGDADIRTLVRAREHLSQLTWTLDDLAGDAAAQASPAALRRVCGAAMSDFASVTADVQAVAAELLAGAPAGAGSDLVHALRAAKTVTDGDAASVVKRALALHVVVDALESNAPQEVVDYAFTAIRPSRSWPDPPPAGTGERPPLAGARFGHFGGFLRASWRLHDWMWGRIDGNGGVVSNLLTSDQIRRLAPPGNPEAARSLATRLAAFVIPADGDGASLAAAAVGDGHDVDEARTELARRYVTAIEAIVSPAGSDAELARLRADVARRFRHAIQRDEIPDLVAACCEDGGRPPAADDLLAEPATALFRLGSGGLCPPPSRAELAQDGANALANALYAFGLHPEGAAVRGIAELNTAGRGTWRALRSAWRYARHVRPERRAGRLLGFLRKRQRPEEAGAPGLMPLG
jgi:hypothetical protein